MLELKALALTPLALLALTGGLYAAQAKTYQVTGPVTALTNDAITVQKGKDLWEIGRDSSTKVSGSHRYSQPPSWKMSTMRFLRTCQLSLSSEAPTASRHSEARWWGGGRWFASAPFSGPHCRASRELRSLTAIHPARPEAQWMATAGKAMAAGCPT